MQDSKNIKALVSAVDDFMQMESASGILLLIAAIAAILIANSPLAGIYDALLGMTVAVQVGALQISKPLLLWVNDGLMAIFFFLIGLELKREVRGRVVVRVADRAAGPRRAGRHAGAGRDLRLAAGALKIKHANVTDLGSDQHVGRIRVEPATRDLILEYIDGVRDRHVEPGRFFSFKPGREQGI